MNKHELIKEAAESQVAKDRGLKQADIAAALDAVTSTITTALSRGESVQVVGYFTFEPKGSPERNGYDPINKQSKVLPESISVKAKAGQKLKNAVQELNPKDYMKASADDVE